MKPSVIQGEIFKSCTPAAALVRAQSGLRATKIKTPNIAGAALPEYRGSCLNGSIEYLPSIAHLDRVEIEAIGLDVLLHTVRNQIIDG